MKPEDEHVLRERANTIDDATEQRLSYDPQAAELLVGWLIHERFQIDRLLAVGGMGFIYRAQDTRGGKPVAVKTLRPEQAGKKQVRERFMREADACRAVRDPHLVEFLGQGNLPDGRPYYLMELLEGYDLGDVLHITEGDLDPVRAIKIGYQIVLALESAHRAGLVHRDLKPDNVIVCPQGDDDEELVKILDFGLAKAVDGSMDVTQIGEVVGTPHYMSPEQIRGGRELDLRTDIYSFGVIFYEMLTGKVPFDGEALVDIMIKHVEEQPVMPSKLDPPIKMPVQLEWMILCCLYKDPEKRFQSATELREELENAGRLYHVDLPALAKKLRAGHR